MAKRSATTILILLSAVFFILLLTACSPPDWLYRTDNAGPGRAGPPPEPPARTANTVQATRLAATAAALPASPTQAPKTGPGAVTLTGGWESNDGRSFILAEYGNFSHYDNGSLILSGRWQERSADKLCFISTDGITEQCLDYERIARDTIRLGEVIYRRY